jgi:hypothetical protein
MPRKSSEEDILATARERFRLIETSEQKIREEARTDLRYVRGDQWDAQDVTSRTTGNARRPCLVFNKLTGPLNQVANEARTNQPGIEVHPVDSQSDPDTAQVLEGMIRHIEYVSKADEVYETALEQSAAGSFGYFKVSTQYVSANSFDQELRIERIPDPFAVYVDPFAQQADKSDMRYAFEVELIAQDDYKAQYGESVVSQLNFYQGMVNPVPGWVGKDGVLVARYWTRDPVRKTLVGIEWPDGKVTGIFEDELSDPLPEGLKYATGPDGKPLERETEVYEVRCRTINGVEILDETEWRGQYIPILYVGGKEMFVEGQRYLFSLVRFARDPQKLYNFYRSSEAETVMLGTKAPWIGVKGAFRDKRWETANTVPWAYLEYEPLDIAGNPVQPPARNLMEPPIQSLSLGAAQASDDIKATTNIFDAALGAAGPETTGIAIQSRQSQSGMANMHFVDNLKRAIRHCGEILVDLIPKIYDTAREVRILGEDRTQQIVKVNQQYVDDKGRARYYDFSLGTYDVALTTGPSYPTQRLQAFETMTRMAQAYPQILQVAGDLIFRNGDFPGADKIADRLQRTLPPELQDQPDGAPPLPPAVQAKMASDQQTIQQLQQSLQQANQALQTQVYQVQSAERIEMEKIASDDRQAAVKAQVDLLTAEMKSKSNEDIAIMRAQLAQVEAQIARMSAPAQPLEPTPPPAATPITA